MSSMNDVKTANTDKIIKLVPNSISTQFNQEQWNQIEDLLDENDQDVIKALCTLGYEYGNLGGDTKYNSDNIKINVDVERKYVLGDNLVSTLLNALYENDLLLDNIDLDELRNELKDNKNNKNNKDNKNNKHNKHNRNTKGNKGKKGKKVSKKVMEIRIQNAKDSINSRIDDIIKTYSLSKLNPNKGFESDVIEIVASAYCYMMKYMIVKHEKFDSDDYYLHTMSLIVSVQRFISMCSDYEGLDLVTPGNKVNISQLMIKVMNRTYDEYVKVYNFDPMKVCNQYPELLVRSTYDEYIPKLGIKPYDHQNDIVYNLWKAIKNDNNLLCMYSAMIGSGKTTSILALGAFVQFLREHDEKYANLQLLFICNLESVKNQVAQLCYNAQRQGYCKFGIAYTSDRFQHGYKIVNHFSTTEEDRVVVICDPHTAYHILNDCSKDKLYGKVEDRFIKFHDEHTIGGDIDGSDALIDNVKCMLHPTRWTILSSATSPSLDELTRVVEHTESVVGEVTLHTVYSDSVHIGMDLYTDTGDRVVPFLNCKDSEDLFHVINQIKTIPLLGRMLTSSVSMQLYNTINELDVDVAIPDIYELFSDVTNMSANSIRNIILNTLEAVAVYSRDVKNIVPLIVGNYERIPTINYTDIGTTNVFEYQTLIATMNPMLWAIEKFDELMTLTKDNPEKHFEKYNKSIKEYEANIDTVSRNIKNEQALSMRLSKLEQNKPAFEYPKYMQIGTRDHAKFVSEITGKPFDNNAKYDEPILFDEYVTRIYAMNVSSIVKKLLLSRVGIYEPNSTELDSEYLTLVLEFASRNWLKYLISDNSITFGTNYPIGCVVITDEFSQNYSVYTALQLLGRAGRVGRSWKATGIVSDNLANVLVDFTINPDKYSIEADNINRMIDTVNESIVVDNTKELDDMESELLKQIMHERKNTVKNVNNSKNNKGRRGKKNRFNSKRTQRKTKTSKTIKTNVIEQNESDSDEESSSGHAWDSDLSS